MHMLDHMDAEPEPEAQVELTATEELANRELIPGKPGASHQNSWFLLLITTLQ
jgi:hypothetical protein